MVSQIDLAEWKTRAQWQTPTIEIVSQLVDRSSIEISDLCKRYPVVASLGPVPPFVLPRMQLSENTLSELSSPLCCRRGLSL